MELPPLDYLKKHCKKIHFFGLGFIQIKISETLRFHFYTGKLESIMPVEEIHNHRYDFTSYILKGSLRQELYQAVSGTTHKFVDVSCTPGEKERSFMMTWAPMLVSRATLEEGSDYFLPNNILHRVQSERCITRVEREPVVKERAAVPRKIDSKPVCPFSKVIPEDTLWEIVEDLLTS